MEKENIEPNKVESVETKETKKKNKKKTMLAIIIGILLIVLLVLLGIYYGMALKSNEPTTNKNSKNSEVKNSESLNTEKEESSKKLPTTIKDLNKTEVEYLNISDIKKYYMTMEDNLYPFYDSNLYDNFKGDKLSSNFDVDYVKVESNKLFWKVNGKWIQDTKIQGDIIYFDLIYLDLGPAEGCIVYSDKTLYKVEFATDNDFKYNIIAKNIEIDNIKCKRMPADCTFVQEYFVESDNKIYIIDNVYGIENINLKLLTKTNSYNDGIVVDSSACQLFGFMFEIDIDGKVKGIQSKLNEIKPVKSDNIVVEYYLAGENYELLIDSNKNYYLYNTFIDENGNKSIEKVEKLKPTGKIKYIGYENKRNRVNITTDDDEKIELYDKSPIY